MFYVKWTIRIVVLTIFAAFLHYTLPQRDVVRIVNTEVQRIDFGENSIFWAQPDTGAAAMQSRDVRFIETFYSDDSPMVFRNEDTGWGWPPYFKLDSANLQAEARDLVSTKTEPQWVVVRHYGWRNEFLTIYPNAISVYAVDGPEQRLIPWFNIVFLTVLAAMIYAIWVRWVRFRRARLDPVFEDIGDSWEAAGDVVEEKRGRIGQFFKNLHERR